MQIDSDGFILWDCEIEFVGILSFLEPAQQPQWEFYSLQLAYKKKSRKPDIQI